MSVRRLGFAVSLMLIGGIYPFQTALADPIAIADELVAAVAGGTRIATYESAIEDGDMVTVTGFVVTDEPNHSFAEVATIEIVNAVEFEEGGFVADSMRLLDGSLTDEANVLSWEVVELINIVIPPVADLAATEGPQVPLSGFNATSIVFDPPQANDVVIESVEVALTEVTEGVPYSVAVTVTGIAVPLDIADNSDPVSILQSMGFGDLEMDFTIAGNFDSEADMLTIDSFGITVREFGNIEISGVFSEMPLSIMQEAGGMEELLASAKVDSARVHFENDGAMDAFLAIQAEMTGVNPQDVAAGLTFLFQAYLQSLATPGLDQQVGVGVSAFLRNPGTLLIVAEPSEPVPLLEIVGLILSAPNALPNLLQLTVTANE